MTRPLRCALAAWALACCLCAHAADVYEKRFDPPRAYFLHATINKSGPAAALKGQDNFLSLYVTGVDNTKGTYAPDQFSLSVLLPAYLEMLDVAEQGLTVTPAQLDGRPYQQVTLKLDAAQMKSRCFDNTWGLNPVLWYRVKEDAAIPAEPGDIRLTLLHGDQTCFTDSARLRIYEPIRPGPRVSPKHFRLWLHYGPHYRPGHYDELAQYLRFAGINAIQFTIGGPAGLEAVQEMRQRGFYIIIQRSGSYESIYKDNMRACLEQGTAWFQQADQGDMARYLPLADAVLWDFEPTPMPTGLDDWLIAQFRQAQGLPADEALNEETIRAKYLRQYIEFRQKQLGTCIKHWADFCRSVNPKIETILTEGGVLAFDPTRQVDYAQYQDDVTFCDPMNFTGAQALRVVRQWMAHAPRARFTGCQNVALSAYHSVFISPRTIMMQTLSAALNGQHGTAVYPGPAMDADNFVQWARVTEFMGRHEALMFEGKPDPANVKLTLLPKEEQEVTLGDGRKLRNTYPDWDEDAIQRSYASPDGSELLIVLANWHAKEQCFGKLAVTLQGQWLLIDDENREIYTQGGKPQLDARALQAGLFVTCPAFDYRGFRLVRSSAAALQAVKGYQPVKLEETRQAALAYTRTTTGGTGTGGAGETQITFDDLNHDGKFEYLVQSPRQKVWISQNGTIVRWTLDGQTLETDGLGLCRDMLWLPAGERENQGMDMVMRLEDKVIEPGVVTLIFSKDVPLSGIGGGASIRVTKEFSFAQAPGELNVTVRLANTSVAPEATQIACSYRAHHYLKYGAGGDIFWANNGETVQQWSKVAEHYTVPNMELSAAETNQLFTQCEVTAPLRPMAFGAYQPAQQLLLKVTPAQSERLLQLLRWGHRAGMADSGTIEWMYRPETLAVGHDLEYEYRLSLMPKVPALGPGAAQPAAAAAAEPHLLFHAAFDGTADAVLARGDGKATVTGTPTYEATDHGQGIVMAKGTALSYLPAGNIDLRRGRLALRFKPLWEGADGQTHFLLTVRPQTGFLYLGKLDDGRFLMNMFGPKDDQHYGFHVIQTLRAGTWHEAVVTWDIERGTMLLIFDGEKAAEVRGEPWEMAPLDNTLAHCRLTIPEQAEAVIDDLKIWDQP